MKQLIFREGIFLTIFSIPVGLLLGFLIAKCGFNWLVEQGNPCINRNGLYGSPKSAGATVFPACYTSLYFRIISYRCFGTAQTNENCFTDFTYRSNTVFRKCRNTQKRKTKWQKKNVTVFSMAMANITGNPKKNHWYHPHTGAFLRIVCDYL